jgi:hypothetical protein
MRSAVGRLRELLGLGRGGGARDQDLIDAVDGPVPQGGSRAVDLGTVDVLVLAGEQVPRAHGAEEEFLPPTPGEPLHQAERDEGSEHRDPGGLDASREGLLLLALEQRVAPDLARVDGQRVRGRLLLALQARVGRRRDAVALAMSGDGIRSARRLADDLPGRYVGEHGRACGTLRSSRIRSSVH